MTTDTTECFVCLYVFTLLVFVCMLFRNIKTHDRRLQSKSFLKVRVDGQIIWLIKVKLIQCLPNGSTTRLVGLSCQMLHGKICQNNNSGRFGLLQSHSLSTEDTTYNKSCSPVNRVIVQGQSLRCLQVGMSVFFKQWVTISNAYTDKPVCS